MRLVVELLGWVRFTRGSGRATMPQPARGGKGVDEGQHPGERPTALLEAVLRFYDELQGIPETRTKRLMDRLDRWHLAWLMLPWFVVLAPWWLLRRGRPPALAGEDRAVDLYRQATGTDERTAAGEVAQLVMQLRLLSNRRGWPVPDGTVRPGGVDRAEVEAAAAALLGYHLAGRRTDDELLGEIVALWAEHMAWLHRDEPTAGRRLRRSEVDSTLKEMDAVIGPFVARYLVAWRRWFDRWAEHRAADPAGR
jgi:hypothetical protein